MKVLIVVPTPATGHLNPLATDRPQPDGRESRGSCSVTEARCVSASRHWRKVPAFPTGADLDLSLTTMRSC